MFIDNGGNVGIGTTAADTKLEIQHDTDGIGGYAHNFVDSPQLLVGGNGNGHNFGRSAGVIQNLGGYVGFGLSPGVQEVTTSQGMGMRMYRDGDEMTVVIGRAFETTYDGNTSVLDNLPTDGLVVSGNVGIGTVAPVTKLEVIGEIIYTHGTDSLAFRTNGDTERMRIDSAGNVGIVTTGPQNKLDIEGAVVIGPSYSGSITVPSNGLLVQGNVGIGTTAPPNKLDVEGAAVIGAGYSATNTAPSNGLLVEGNVGIGITNPTDKLHVEGFMTLEGAGSRLSLINNTNTKQFEFFLPDSDAFGRFEYASMSFRFVDQDSNTIVMELPADGTGGNDISLNQYSNGTLSISSGIMTTASDIRLKTVQRNVTYGLAAIREIQLIVYTWNDKTKMHSDTEHIGFSAQNVQSVIPETVSVGKDGYLSLENRGIIAALVNAVKELDAENKSLKSQLADIEARLSALEAK